MQLNHSLNSRWLCHVILFCLLATINSCKKTNFVNETSIADPAINDAKLWYNDSYPQLAATQNAKTTIRSMGQNADKTDLSRVIKPNWQRGASYKRFNSDVVETPVEKLQNVNFSLGEGNKQHDPKNTKASFLLLKKDGKYSAYVMMIVGDSTYVQNDTAKLNRNTYRKRDANFSGMVLYFTPKGDFINSYVYKTGKLVKSEVPDISKQTNGKSTLKANTIDYDAAGCIHYYWIIRFVDDGSIVSATYLYSICDGGASGGGGGGSGGPSTSPCSIGTLSIKKPISTFAFGDEEYDDGGGFPPPGNPPTNPPPTSGSPCTEQAPSEQKLAELLNELALNPDLLIKCDILEKFKTLANYKPGQTVFNRISNLNSQSNQSTLFSNPYFVLQIQNAAGYRINFDRFEIKITNLPTVNGHTLSATEMLDMIRQNMDGFVDVGIAHFEPYYDPADNLNDAERWNSNNPLGAVSRIKMNDNGSIIISDFASDQFTVSTLRTPLDGAHPVSGNRKWGYDHNPDNSYTFYVSGADRVTTQTHELMQYIFGIPFSKADQLWTSFQTKLTNYVNTHNGQATVGQQIKERPDYQSIKDYLSGKITLNDLKVRHGCI